MSTAVVMPTTPNALAQASVTGFGPYLERPYLNVWDKRQKIRDIITENNLHPDETLFIGDMQHDIETAKHGGIHSCAVLTGYNTLDRLRAAQPDLIVEHLGELRERLAGARKHGRRQVGVVPLVETKELVEPLRHAHAALGGRGEEAVQRAHRDARRRSGAPAPRRGRNRRG